MTTLHSASTQWATRPADQRFSSIAELHAVCAKYQAEAVEATRPISELTVKENENGLDLSTARGAASLSWWSFGQLSRLVGAPASYLRKLPKALAASCLNDGLSTVTAEDSEKEMQILLNRNGDLRVRAITSEQYSRIWNADITKRLLQLEAQGPWQPAPAAFDGSRGLYASDHDLFAFLVDNGRRIFEKRLDGGLSRGFFVSNSEVGAASLTVTMFLYSYVCGNHIVWDAKDVKELRLRHVGIGDGKGLREMMATLSTFADRSAEDDEAKIESSIRYSLGTNKDEALDRIFGLGLPGLTKSRILAALTTAETAPEVSSVGASPYSAWGAAQGITRISQSEPYADARVEMDRSAGKIIALAF